MAQADIIIADDKLLPQAVELYNAVFRPKREVDFFKRRFMGRYNPLTLIARMDSKPVGFWVGFELKPGMFYHWLGAVLTDVRRHGIGRHAGGDRVEVEVRREDGQLLIEVRNRNSVLDPQAPPPSPETRGHGIGLANTRLRLRELYGEAAELRLDVTWPHGVACRLRLPARELDEAAQMRKFDRRMGREF